MLGDRLRALIAEILDMPAAEVRDDMRRGDTGRWDSMNHLRLVTAIEDEFGVALTMDEIANVQTPGELQDIIDARSGGAGAGEADPRRPVSSV